MSITSIEDLKKMFETSEHKQPKQISNYYAFWNMPLEQSAIIRFLPDKNQDNPFAFMVEKHAHPLMVVGKKNSVACLRMFGEECPICKVSSDFYKRGDKVNGLKYYRKVQYLTQVLVIKDPIPLENGETVNQVGKVKPVAINYSLYKILMDAVKHNELDDLPYSYKVGTNFVIKKDKQGEYANYALSKFERKPSALEDEVIEYVKENIIDLSTLLPKNPGRERVDLLLDAALSGKSLEALSEVLLTEDGLTETSDTVSVDSSAKVVNVQSVSTPTSKEADADVNSILAKIRARKNNPPTV